MLIEKTSLQKSEMADCVKAYLPVYYFNKVLSFSYCYDGIELKFTLLGLCLGGVFFFRCQTHDKTFLKHTLTTIKHGPPTAKKK